MPTEKKQQMNGFSLSLSLSLSLFLSHALEVRAKTSATDMPRKLNKERPSQLQPWPEHEQLLPQPRALKPRALSLLSFQGRTSTHTHVYTYIHTSKAVCVYMRVCVCVHACTWRLTLHASHVHFRWFASAMPQVYLPAGSANSLCYIKHAGGTGPSWIPVPTKLFQDGGRVV